MWRWAPVGSVVSVWTLHKREELVPACLWKEGEGYEAVVLGNVLRLFQQIHSMMSLYQLQALKNVRLFSGNKEVEKSKHDSSVVSLPFHLS